MGTQDLCTVRVELYYSGFVHREGGGVGTRGLCIGRVEGWVVHRRGWRGVLLKVCAQGLIKG